MSADILRTFCRELKRPFLSKQTCPGSPREGVPTPTFEQNSKLMEIWSRAEGDLGSGQNPPGLEGGTQPYILYLSKVGWVHPLLRRAQEATASPEMNEVESDLKILTI